MKQFEEKFGKRVLVNCNDLAFNLQSCVAENEEGPTTNVRLATNQGGVGSSPSCWPSIQGAFSVTMKVYSEV